MLQDISQYELLNVLEKRMVILEQNLLAKF